MGYLKIGPNVLFLLSAFTPPPPFPDKDALSYVIPQFMAPGYIVIN